MDRRGLDSLLATAPIILDGEAGLLRRARESAKHQLKALNVSRKAMAKDNFEGKSQISAEIKRVKKRLHEVETELLTLLSGESASAQPEQTKSFSGEYTITEDVTGWDDFVTTRGASHYHRMRWREVFGGTMARDTKYLSARGSQNEILGVLPLAITRSRVFGNYGVSLPYVNYGAPCAVADNLETALITHAFGQADAWGITHIEIRDTKERPGMEARKDKFCMILDLTDKDSYPQLLTFLGSKVRAQVNKSLSSGIQFEAGGTELLHKFYKVFATNMRDLGTPVYAVDFFASIMDTFPNDTTLVVGSYRGEPVCCAFLLDNNGAWEIPWASTLRSANRIAANMALYATVLQQVIERGGRQFDFGRSSLDAPTYRFKKQWKAEPTQLYWYYSSPEYANALTTSSPKFQLAIQIWKRLPLSIANTLGPHLVKNLP